MNRLSVFFVFALFGLVLSAPVLDTATVRQDVIETPEPELGPEPLPEITAEVEPAEVSETPKNETEPVEMPELTKNETEPVEMPKNETEPVEAPKNETTPPTSDSTTEEPTSEEKPGTEEPSEPGPVPDAPASGSEDTTSSEETGSSGSSTLEEQIEAPTPTSESPQRPPCFPGSALVTLESGATKRMADLAVGDRVAVAAGMYSDVFMFTHKLANIKYNFVQLTTATATLRLTDGHFLPINGVYQPAKRAAVGDFVELADGTAARISDVHMVPGTGLYNPQTSHGDIVVDGIRASTYTEAVAPKMAHAMLAPLRAACRRVGLYATFLEAGADRIASFTSRFA